MFYFILFFLGKGKGEVNMAIAALTSSMSSSFAPREMKPLSLLATKDTKTGDKIKMPNTERVDRTSFSSIKESQSGIAQSFTDSKTSSYLRNQLQEEEAIDDAPSGVATPKSREIGKMLMSPCNNCGSVCPCDGFRGWKGISIRGKVASKSFGDLKALGMGGRWEWDVNGDKMDLDEGLEVIRKKGRNGRYPAGQSPIETLPTELLISIIDQLATDIPPNGFTARNIDLMSLLLTSRGMHGATLTTLYSQITIPHSRIFRKFLSHITAHPSLGTIVRRLDFSHFNPTGAGQTARERAQTLNLIPATLLQCLSLTPNLREFLAQEHIDDDLSSSVLRTLFTSLPRLKALDFCACSSTSFRDAFTTVITSPLPTALPITRLSLHECTILPSSIFEILLPKLPRLTHLDVAHTRITDTALFSLPSTASLTHLNLSKCSSLSGSAVVEFLRTHDAARELVYLNLAMDAKSAEMLTAADVSDLLPILPHSLRSLNLKGSKMDASHVPLLIPLSKHVEELGLGRHLSLADIKRLFVQDENKDGQEQRQWGAHSLRYVDVSDLSVAELDLGTLFSSSCPVLKTVSSPLEVLELAPDVYKKLGGSERVVRRVGWCLKEAGRRGWLVRELVVVGVGKGQGEVEVERDDGKRGWKWGASYWGMRKVPVARAEVGGMYGHYMFKR